MVSENKSSSNQAKLKNKVRSKMASPTLSLVNGSKSGVLPKPGVWKKAE